jgi:nucleoside-diphosphate-sugar epimerase
LFAENCLKHYAAAGVVKGVILRLANVYGPGPKSSASDRGVLNMMIKRAIHGQPLTVYREGANLRDFLYVEDAIQAFLTAAARINAISGKHFVIGSGAGTTILDAMVLIAKLAADNSCRPVTIRKIDPPPHLSPIEFRHFVADTNLFTQLTGWKAKWRLTEGIEATIRALKSKEILD